MKLSKKQQEIVDHIESKKEQSQKNEGSLVKISAGFYIVTIEGETITIDRMENGEWIAREFDYKWYADPAATLKEVRQDLGI